MYDALSADYDRFVNWQGRLAIELPFIIEKLHQAGAKSVLDAATGTGMHAIALAQCGFTTAGADLSQGMVERAYANARSAEVQVRFEQAGFGNLSQTFGGASFDGLLCLGNSLPHLLSNIEITAALVDFAVCLKPGGLLLLQNRNFDAIMARRERWMEPQSHTEGDSQWIFQRFYDFDPDGLITFNMVTLKRIGQGSWNQSISTSRLRPLIIDELLAGLQAAGFGDITTYGSMAGTPFEPGASSNLVVVAKK
ncbi:MAG TPA: class I SAM-dependent methyltransferase [Anaerolineales bacterium]|nr:class I SAM-dependent methyltransferase [Anaerolineales bacterium]